VVIGMLLFSERTWKHHAVTLLLPFAVLCYYLAACRPTAWVRSGVIAALATAVLLMACTSTGLLGDRLGELGQVYGAFVWALVVLLAALVLLLRQPAPDPADCRKIWSPAGWSATTCSSSRT